MGEWLTGQDVADFLRLPESTERCDDAAAAAAAWVQYERRVDLATDDDGGYAPTPNVFRAAVMFAALLVQADTTPGGFPAADELQTDPTYAPAMGTIFTLLGRVRPVVA